MRSLQNIASTIFHTPYSVLDRIGEGDIYSLIEEKKRFFSAELSFFLFFLVGTNFLKKNRNGKDLILSLEDELAKTFVKNLKGRVDDYKTIMGNRFNLYWDVKSSELENRVRERKEIFLQCLQDDINNGGFSVVTDNPNYSITSNLLHRFLYDMCLEEIIKNREIEELI